jgi:hypothetical protein
MPCFLGWKDASKSEALESKEGAGHLRILTARHVDNATPRSFFTKGWRRSIPFGRIDLIRSRRMLIFALDSNMCMPRSFPSETQGEEWVRLPSLPAPQSSHAARSRQGNTDVAIRFEQLSNVVAITHEVNVLFAYPLTRFHEEDEGEFQSICAKHSGVCSRRSG